MSGKQKCRILKEIRQRIADENDIPFVTKECTFQGDCSGTCPRCESELRYLEGQLALRASMKKKVTVAALCAGMMLATGGCSSPVPTPTSTTATTEEVELSGEVPYEDTEDCTTTTTTTKEDVTKPVDIGTDDLSGAVPYTEEP